MKSCLVVSLALVLSSIGMKTGWTDPIPPAAVPGRVLVSFHPNVSDAQRDHIVAAAGGREAGRIPQIDVRIVQLPEGASETAAIHTFAQRPEVLFMEADEARLPDTTPNDPYYPNEWHLQKIAAPAAWTTTTGSSGVIIAILDTGVDGTHPDLAAKMVPGWNFYDNNSNTSDVYGHGTAVAGTAAAISNNGAGVTSVAWNCLIMPIRISDTTGYAYYSTAANALTWAADHGARVANLSYEFSTSSTVASAAQYFQSKGGVVTVSAGNDATVITSPDTPSILTVSATTSTDAPASFTNTGSNIDLAAPGVSVLTTNRGGGYGSWSGTSFSASIVAGVAALVISANPSLSASQIQSILETSADDLGAAGWDLTYGYGRVNAGRAVAAALSTVNPPADTTPPTVSFSAPTGGATVSGTVSVQVAASDNVGGASVSLSINGSLVSTDTGAPYTFSWNTTAVPNGGDTLTAMAKDAAGNVTTVSIPVTVSNAADTTPPTVAITSPANGASVKGNVSVTVNASDNVKVAKVELYVDGVLTAASTTAPFTRAGAARKPSAARTGSPAAPTIPPAMPAHLPGSRFTAIRKTITSRIFDGRLAGFTGKPPVGLLGLMRDASDPFRFARCAPAGAYRVRIPSLDPFSSPEPAERVGGVLFPMAPVRPVEAAISGPAGCGDADRGRQLGSRRSTAKPAAGRRRCSRAHCGRTCGGSQVEYVERTHRQLICRRARKPTGGGDARLSVVRTCL